MSLASTAGDRRRARQGTQDMGELIAAGKPSRLAQLLDCGVGSASISVRAAARDCRFEAQHIPFKGRRSRHDVIADGPISACSTATTVPQIREGNLVPLAVSAHKRIALLPDVPTTIETACRRSPCTLSIPALSAGKDAARRRATAAGNRQALDAPAVKARLARSASSQCAQSIRHSPSSSATISRRRRAGQGAKIPTQ